MILNLVLGLKLKSYRFKKYKKNLAIDKNTKEISTIDVIVTKSNKLKKDFVDYNALCWIFICYLSTIIVLWFINNF